MGQGGLHERLGKLETLASIELAAPQCALGQADISHPLAVAGKIQIAGGNAAEIGNKIARFRVVAHEFSPRLDSDHEQFLAVITGKRVAILQRSSRKLNRIGWN